MEKESHKTIKELLSDKGGEYDSKFFANFCKYHGIKRQFISIYTPQQNGIVERKNITLMDMARSMLKEKNFKMNFGVKQLHVQYIY